MNIPAESIDFKAFLYPLLAILMFVNLSGCSSLNDQKKLQMSTPNSKKAIRFFAMFFYNVGWFTGSCWRVFMRMNLRVNYLIVIIGIIMGLLIGFGHNKFAYTHVGASGGVLSIESAYQQFLPIIYRSGVPEVDTPPCRWPNNPEQNYYIAYKWGDGLQDPQNVWRIAFQEGISTWNGADTPVYYYYNTSTINIIDTYELADETRGRTKITCQKVGEEITTIRIEVTTIDVGSSTLTATVSGNDFDPNESNNSASLETVVTPANTPLLPRTMSMA